MSEGSYYTSPAFRMRHYYFKMETPVIDVLAGQYWVLFGWQSMFHPNTVEIQGVPGQIYSRTPQLRLSKTIKTDPINVEIAASAARPVQRDSEVPDGTVGIRLAFNGWKGIYAHHGRRRAQLRSTPRRSAFPPSAATSRMPNFSPSPTSTVSIKGYGYSFDAMIPIIPATDAMHPDNALTFTGSFVYGQAIADLYTNLSGGASFAALPTTAAGAAQNYPQDVDNGLIAFYRGRHPARHPLGVVHPLVCSTTCRRRRNRMFISASYSLHMHSPDIDALGATSAKLFDKSDWVDGNLFVDANAAVRFGVEYAYFHQSYLDGSVGKNNRVQFSAFYIF